MLRPRFPDLGLGVTQCHTLLELQRAPHSLGELCALLHVDDSTGSRNLATLARHGFVLSERDAADPRRKLFRLTAEGRAQVRRIHAHGDDVMRRAFAYLTPDERAAATRALELLARAVARSQDTAVEIRRLRRSDNRALAQVIRGVLDEYGFDREHSVYNEPDTDRLYELYKSADGCYLVALSHGEVQGGGGLLPHGARACELKHFYFAPAVRGGGHAKRLLNGLLDWARDAGYPEVFLETHRGAMKEAVALYQQFGFRTGRAPTDYCGHAACDTIMSREL